jgi:hypothetical protein
VVDGVLRKLTNRRRCLACLPFGERRSRPPAQRKKARTKKQRKWLAKRQQTLGEPHHCHLRRTRKEALVRFLGGTCQFCGYSRCLGNLGFHHAMGDKQHTVSGRELQFALQRIVNEVRKCALVCANCHGEIHAGLIPEGRVAEARKVLGKKVEALGGKSWGQFLNQPTHRKPRPPCKHCGDPCSTPKGVYCSLRCKALDERRVERPTKVVLGRLVGTLTWTEIGRRFGVSDNTVRKWAKGYGL